LPTLARTDDITGLEVEVLQPEVEALRGAHPRRIEELEDRAVAHAVRLGRVRRFHERRGRVARQRPRQRAPAPRDLDVLRGNASSGGPWTQAPTPSRGSARGNIRRSAVRSDRPRTTLAPQ